MKSLSPGFYSMALVAASVFSPALALAQETPPADAAATAPAAASQQPAAETAKPAADASPLAVLTKAVTPYGLLGAAIHVVDSAKSNPLNNESLYARFGLKVKEGIAVGQLELDPATTPVEGKPRGLIGVRHANLGLDLATGTKILFGRYRLGGADGFGADKTYVPDQFSSMDGVALSQKFEFGEGVNLTAGLAVSNGMLNIGQTEGVYGTDGGGRFNRRKSDGSLAPVVAGASNRVFQEKSFKDDRAVVVSLKGEVRGVAFAAYHGFESNQLVRSEVAAKSEFVPSEADKNVPELKETAAVAKGVADATHTEVSLGYNGIEGISFGGWYTLMTQGKIKSVTKEEGGAIETTSDGQVSYERTNLGVGVMGDSTLFGVKDLLQSGDKLIYSASYAQTNWAVGGSGADAVEADFAQTLKDAAKDSSTVQYVVAGGYKVGGLSLELNLAQEVAEGKIFANSKGEAGKTDTQTNVYLATYYEF